MSKTVRDPFATSTAEAEAKQAELAREEYEFREALKQVLETRAGKTVFRRLFAESGFFGSAFDTNALNMARKEGKREFAQTIFEYVIKHKPEFIQELREQNE